MLYVIMLYVIMLYVIMLYVIMLYVIMLYVIMLYVRVGLARTLCIKMYIVCDRIKVDFPARNTVYTPYIYIYMVLANPSPETLVVRCCNYIRPGFFSFGKCPESSSHP
jgi:hypothetical protein